MLNSLSEEIFVDGDFSQDINKEIEAITKSGELELILEKFFEDFKKMEFKNAFYESLLKDEMLQKVSMFAFGVAYQRVRTKKEGKTK